MLQEGVEKMKDIWKSFGYVIVHDKSRIWCVTEMGTVWVGSRIGKGCPNIALGGAWGAYETSCRGGVWHGLDTAHEP